MRTLAFSALALLLATTDAQAARPEKPVGCAALPGYEALKKALTEARQQDNGGLNNDMWGVMSDRSGTVCAVAYTGATVGAQWPGSRLIAAAKANTANAFSLDGFALSTANLYAGAQPGAYLYGIADAHPVNQAVAYKGPASAFGTASDPLVGNVAGGAITFGGGVPLYGGDNKIAGGLGVSGDTACADHNIAWRTRKGLNFDHVSGGPSPDKNDQIIYDMKIGGSTSGFGHPTCGNKEDDITKDLPATASQQK